MKSAKIWLLVVVIGLTCVTVAPGQAQAFGLGDIPGDQQSALLSYDILPTSGCLPPRNEEYAVQNWLSQGGVPANDGVITVPAGTTSIPLQFNGLIFACHVLVNPPN